MERDRRSAARVGKPKSTAGRQAQAFPTVYDCLYLALAIRERTWVVTADRRFHNVAARIGDLAKSVRMLV